ncbi:radical SAM family heme chaperone HemW [Pigmentiphaga sp.]|uniref:radical SAM family heme chaperone HemW n=1 Tax=Pigmentiphaga sp. TaxID=1977564 RepID=UPI00128BD113|nr:radical SAM family heme chaperone HemW [Pigmentiphaga sp.]MPS26315.1 oxygen-independent coproporphyrinogen III oxidase-like protein [Alcaligenaceae bacterium SAGV5]MPS53428.1 oxygen-independent coproporphyrinogen III oxidase-like protein [Alcaligenaceae bacterium SAGV3]MPT56364.1 oxygen-independent coproporphyrinogen III oxidase-like protein [Alcaligenaceae bacterium]
MARSIPIRPAGQGAPVARAAMPFAPGPSLLTSLPPLSVYVHVPWCVRKCPYCDFNSHAAPDELPEDRYLQALTEDLDQSLPQVWGRKVVSVFIGGGTPSLLSAATMDAMLALLRSRLPLLPDAEITMEANPGTVEAARFADFAASGINRISLGIQSFDDDRLRALGRIHDGRAAREAIAIAQRHVERINLDLMFALPGQTLDGCLDDVETALSFGTEHLSLYHLTLEPNTVFAKYPPELPDDDTAFEMQDRIEARLAGAGYDHYEISAYARPGARCRHNLNYWEFGDYLGIGPGAHGKLSFHDRILREARVRNPQSWMDALLDPAAAATHLAESRLVEAKELPFEFMLNALRLADGVPAASFAERTGLNLATIARPLARAVERGLLDEDPTRIRATPLGRRFLNDLQGLFL